MTKPLIFLCLFFCFSSILYAQSFSPVDYGPALWLDAADSASVIHTSGSVSAWNDISGNGHHVTQATAINQPNYVSTVDGLEFDGIDDVLIGDNLLLYGPDTTITIFVVASPDSASSKGSVIAKGQWTSGNDYRIELGENGYDICLQNARQWNSSANDWNIAHKNLVHTFYDKDKSVGYYLNGAVQELLARNVPYNPNSSPFSIGGRFSYNNFFDGRIYEVILFQKKLSRCEILQVEGYLYHKWDLKTHIIPNHSYKNLPFGICEELQVYVDENSPNGTVVDTLKGSYVDTATTFSDWRIEDEGPAEGTFTLDSNGRLSVLDSSLLDYEFTSALNLEVSAVAGGSRVYGGVRVNINDMPDAGVPKTNSVLWGVQGERWDPRGRLPDFSYVGYASGEKDYHYVNTIVDVTDFGADNTDTLSDVAAIMSAINSIDSGIVYFPAGYYVIDDYITITKDNIVLRGAGIDSISGTRFYMPNSSSDLSGSYDYIISFKGTLAGPIHFLTESTKMGDRSVTLNNVSGLSVGELVGLGFSGTHPPDGELWDHILNDQNQDWPCSVAWSNGNGGLGMYHTIERIDGNIVTLKEPIRLDMDMAWTPHLIRRTDWYVKNCGVEDIYIEHKYIPQPPHLQEPGYNSVSFSRAFNCWIKNVGIKHADNGIRFDVSAFSEMRDIYFYGRGGHHGWTFAYSSHMLADSIYFHNYAPWIHSFTLTHKANGNVISNVKGIPGIPISSDFHRNTPWETLMTNIDNDWNYNSSGVWCAGPNAGKRTVYWNMGGGGFTYYPLWDDYQTTLVGDMHIEERFHPDRGWHEHIANIDPPNLYEAQLNRRFNLPPDPLFCADTFSGDRNNYWERDPSRWKIHNGEYQLYFSEVTALTGGRVGEYAVLDSIHSGNMFLSCDVRSLEKLNINTEAEAALILNYQDDNNYYFALISTNSSLCGIYKVQGGTSTLLRSFVPVTSFGNSFGSYIFQNTNGVLSCYENGILIDSISDVTFTGGKVGFGSLDDAVSFDNVTLDSYCSSIVLNTNDAGYGSLRRVIDCARPGDTIQFSPAIFGQSIVLNSPIVLDKDLVFRQTSGSLMIIRVDHNGPIFSVLSDVDIYFGYFHFSAGTTNNGVEIENAGSILFENFEISIYD